MPTVLRFRPGRTNNDPPLLLVAPSPLFGVGLGASICMIDDDGFEVLLGEGRILTVQQEQKTIQVLVTDQRLGYDETWDDLKRNDKATLGAVFIRPGNQVK